MGNTDGGVGRGCTGSITQRTRRVVSGALVAEAFLEYVVVALVVVETE